MEMKLEHVHTVRKKLKDGSYREYFFHRKTRKPIKGKPGTLEFFASYQEACEQGTSENGTLKALIIDYFSSQNFASKAPRTQKDYRKHIKYIEEKFGSMPIQALNDKRVRGDFITWRDDLAKKSPRLADHCLNLLKAILKLAADKNLIEVSYVHGIQNVYKSDRSDKIWKPDQIEALFAVAKPSLRALVMTALNTGQREGDLIRLQWDKDYKDGLFAFRQSKRQRFVKFEATPNLRLMLDSLPRRCEYIHTTETGLPWNVNHLGSEFRDAKLAAKIDGLTFNDLRGTAVTVLWESGANEGQIATITGHSLKSVSTILERYTSRTAGMSAVAIEKLSSSWIGQLSHSVN